METATRPPPGGDWSALAANVAQWGREGIGFQEIGIADTDSTARNRLLEWLEAGLHGEMDYMARHGVETRAPRRTRARHVARDRRAHELLPAGGESSARSSAIPARHTCRATRWAATITKCCAAAAAVAERVEAAVGSFSHRVFTDSAPVMEVELAAKAGSAGAASNAAPDARSRLVFLSGRDLHRPAAAGRPRREAEHCGTAARASTSARPARSSRHTGSTRAAASHT